MNTMKLRSSITCMLQLQNNSTNRYNWLSRYTLAELRAMMTGWQVNQPDLFNKHGIYTM